ncbi:glycosyltransferase [Candidatus Gottesmanbacteria bacterium]|nr:glycosyltransferase [Candidatus Gottesmanbacteria bacterium]
MIELSVVIPTYNKKEILKKALRALNNQSCGSDKFEVIMIDDGSNDGTEKEIKNLIPKLKFKTSIFFQKHQGPAAARNKGIKKAQGKIVLITNDDTIATPDLLARHLEFHRRNGENFALLGFVTWHPSLTVTPFMYWLEHGGPYFSFDKIKGKEAGWERLWTCNISFKKKFLLENGLFDEEFPSAAWEDVELGYRLGQVGLKLVYNKKAVGYHYHPTTITSIKDKMKNNGHSVLILKKKIPNRYLPPLGRYPSFFVFFDKIIFNPFFLFLLEKVCLFFEDKLNLGVFYDLLLLHYRIKGLKK